MASRRDAARPAARRCSPGAPAASRSAARSQRVSALATDRKRRKRRATLPQMLAWHVRGTPARALCSRGRGRNERTVTYARARPGRARGRRGPGRARARGRHRRWRSCCPPGVDYFFSFFGILLAGGVPVPIYPPARCVADRGPPAAPGAASSPTRAPGAGHGAARRRRVARLLQAARARRCAHVRHAAADCRLPATPRRPCTVRRRTDIALHPVHLGQHRQSQGRRAHARQPARQHPRHGRRRCRRRRATCS